MWATSNQIAGGTWRHMMSARPRKLAVFNLPKLGDGTAPSAGLWKVTPDLGVSGAAVVAMAPPGTPAITKESLAGPVTVRAFCLPTHRLNADHRLRYAVAIDDESPQIVDLETEEFSRQWAANILRAAAIGESQPRIPSTGRHTLKIWMLDPGVALDRFEILPDAPAHIPLPTASPAR